MLNESSVWTVNEDLNMGCLIVVVFSKETSKFWQAECYHFNETDIHADIRALNGGKGLFF